MDAILFCWAAKRALDSSVLKDRAAEVPRALWSTMKSAKAAKKENNGPAALSEEARWWLEVVF